MKYMPIPPLHGALLVQWHRLFAHRAPHLLAINYTPTVGIYLLLEPMQLTILTRVSVGGTNCPQYCFSLESCTEPW